MKTAKQHDAHTLYLLQTVPGIGKILSLVLLYAMHQIDRFPSVQDVVSYCRLVTCSKASGGKRLGTSGTKIGNAHLKWAFSEAATLFLRNNLRAKDGSRSSGWAFVRGGAFAEAADARSGRSALALIGRADYQLISQRVPVTAGKTYRVSGWVKTARPTAASTFTIRFANAAGSIGSLQAGAPIPQNQTTPYRLVSKTFVAPATAEAMDVSMRLAERGTGSVFYDDLMVEEQ